MACTYNVERGISNDCFKNGHLGHGRISVELNGYFGIWYYKWYFDGNSKNNVVGSFV